MPSKLAIVRFIPAPPIRKIAEATPASRDRVIDGLRAFSLSVVVFGHCFMALVLWRNGVPHLGNSLALHRPLQVLTWVLQVMPLFFFAGGASNAITWSAKRSGGYPAWLWSRAARLLRPLWVYFAIMAPLSMVVALLAPTKVSAPLLLLTTQLLWFLGAYLIVTALGPLLQRSYGARPLATFAVLGLGAISVDICRFVVDLPAALGIINFVLVWSLAALFGISYVERPPTPKVALGAAALAVAINVVLVDFANYPLSMVGMPGDKFSNMAPPTVVLGLHAVAICLVAIALKEPLQRLFARQRPWAFAVAINTVAMTLYLWHLPMLILLMVLEHATGLGVSVAASHGIIATGSHFWFFWPIHFAVFVAFVWLIVRVLWVLENTALPLWDSPSRFRSVGSNVASVMIGIGVFLCGAALLMFSATGLGGFPTRVVHFAGLPLTSGLALLLLFCGASLIRIAGAPRQLAA